MVNAATSVRGYAVATGDLQRVHTTAADSSVDGRAGGVAFGTLRINDSRTVVAVPAWGSTVSAVRVADGVTLWTWRAVRDYQRRHGAQGAV